MSSKRAAKRRTQPQTARELMGYEAPGWLSTDDLEQELFLAVLADSRRPRARARFERIDAYFAQDEPETELQYRRSLLRLLAELRPQLAELVGGPRQR